MERKTLVLSSLVIGTSDVVRLKREVEALDDYLHQASLRKAGDEIVKLPKTSRVMDEFAATNSLNLLQPESRKQALDFLHLAHTKAPVVHMSFAAEPSAAFMQKLALWWRQNIDLNILLEVGLQPNIAIGCIVRTSNKQYDFSLRQHFIANRDKLIEQLKVGNKA